MKRESDFYVFSIAYAYDDFASVAELNEKLNDIGIDIRLTADVVQDGCSSSGNGTLAIKINNEVLNKNMTRKKGKNSNYIEKTMHKYNPTLREFYEIKKTMTHQQIIDKMGCTKYSYYKRYKDIVKLYGKNGPNEYETELKFFI